jgi:hypothetical protein
VLICLELDTIPDGSIVGAKDALVAAAATLAVPVNVPVNDPLKLPVLICVELETIPAGLFASVFQSATAPAT